MFNKVPYISNFPPNFPKCGTVADSLSFPTRQKLSDRLKSVALAPRGCFFVTTYMRRHCTELMCYMSLYNWSFRLQRTLAERSSKVVHSDLQ